MLRRWHRRRAARRDRRPPPIRRRRWLRWLVRGAIATACLVAATIITLAVAIYAIDYPVDRLDPGRGGPLIITDRNGVVLRTVPSPDGRPGRDSWVPIEEVSSLAVLTFIASEDQGFFDHSGVDKSGVARALWLNLRERRIGYGGSTITMQLVRMLHSRGQPRTLSNKIKEAVLAMRLERAVDKKTILEQYLNRAYFGYGAYGIEAAAQTYFDKPAASLSPGEATLLAVVPRAPASYDLIEHLDSALDRRDHVLSLLAEQGLMTPEQVDRARSEQLRPVLSERPFLAPHFCDWVIAQLPESVRHAGGIVRTTLDLDLQQQLEREVSRHVEKLRERNVTQAGVVVLDTASGKILSMVGSADYWGQEGQINITTRRRHPGSALKPFVYALAIESGDHPATIAYDVHDVPSAYKVIDEPETERGPVRYREALAGSYNLAAVHTLERVGVERMMSALRRSGAGPVPGNPDDYGLRLALGSTRVRLLDLAAAYGWVARDGKSRRPTGVLRVNQHDGGLWLPDSPDDVRVFSRQTSWLIADMMSDPVARRPAFGQELAIDLPYPVAVKTGTARGFADTVAVAITRELTVAAWAGNFDGKPTSGVIAMDGAAPLVRAGLLHGSRGAPLTLPEQPEGIETASVCPLSGLRPGPSCPHRKREYFARGTVPSETCDWHQGEPGDVTVHYPIEIHRWARRQRTRGGRLLPVTAAARTATGSR